MKGITKRFIAVCMTFVILSVTPLNEIAPNEISEPATAMAAGDDKGGKYISEIRIGQGETEDEAKKELEEGGYTILKDDAGNYADLNEGAGSKSALKKGANDKIIYLGYKTTSDPNDAITDISVMNEGTEGNRPYSTEDYNVLMEKTMTTKIRPFVDKFIATLEEYRENYKKSGDTLNHMRADQVRRLLNKLTDDDTGKPMGDLLLNKTKYEMGDSAYNALSDAEKKNHADILTILMQANGKATLVIEILLSKATDTSSDTWIDRLTSTSYESLEERMQEENPGINSKADLDAALDKKYYDTAMLLLEKWNEFNEEITNYENTADEIENSAADIESMAKEAEKINLQKATKEEARKFIEANTAMTKQAYDLRSVGVSAYLDSVQYEGDTLLNYFSRSYDEVKTNSGIRTLYPIVDALSPGQIAGLEFLTFEDLFTLALADKDTYGKVLNNMDSMQDVSIYEGVDREIYEPGGVGITSDSLRKSAVTEDSGNYVPGALQWVLIGVTAGCAAVSISSYLVSRALSSAGLEADRLIQMAAKFAIEEEESILIDAESVSETRVSTVTATTKWGSSFARYLSWGAAAVTVLLMAATITMTVLDAIKYYDVDFALIPNIMVDTSDIMLNGEMIKNQTAYYRAVRCNRKEGDSDIEKRNYKAMGDKADLNGDIGRQWLALYTVKYKYGKPILADSLLYKKNDGKLPDGYVTGIHEFNPLTDKTQSPACNLNKKSYLFAGDPPSIYVYYKTESESVSDLAKAGSIFSVGSLALGGGCGIIIGALFMGLIMRRRRPTEERAL